MATQLPHLPDVERLSPVVLRLLGGNPGKFTLQGTNTYLVGNGAQRILIDTGEGLEFWSKLLSSTLSSEEITISDVIITHWHPDHVGGIKDLHKLCPNARVYKYSPSEGQSPLKDGQVFAVEGAALRTFHCPGHTKDHMAVILKEEDAMFTGDNVLGHGTAVFEDLGTYMESLDRMRQQFSGRAYPGHGAVIDNGKQRIAEYIEHRQQREREVLNALADAAKDAESSPGKSKARTPMELVKVIYKDVPENLWEAASKGVVQILEKLAAEGKVVRLEDGKRWQIAEKSNAMI